MHFVRFPVANDQKQIKDQAAAAAGDPGDPGSGTDEPAFSLHVSALRNSDLLNTQGLVK